MSFQDPFTGTSGDKLDTRTGWAIIGSEGLYNFEITGSGDALRSQSNGSGSGDTAYSCTDQGSADHYTQIKLDTLVSAAGDRFCVRFVDVNNYVCVRLAGTGASGLRMTKVIGGLETDIVTMQGVAGDTYRAKTVGDQYSLWYDSGSTGSFTQEGSDQTISNSDLSTAETTQGCIAGGSYTTRFDDFEAGAAGGNTITANQTESGDTTAATIKGLVQVSSNQSETGDTSAAVLRVLNNVAASQLESGDTQTAAVVGVITATITASQAEAGDITAAAIDNIVQIDANQAEDGDTQAAAVTTQITATVTASQTEAGDAQAATLINLVQILANQNEAGDTQAAGLNVPTRIAANQTEAGDAQVAAILSGTIILEPGRIFTASLPQRTFRAAVPQRTFKAALPQRTFKAAA